MLRLLRTILPLVLVCFTASIARGGIITFDFATTASGAANQAGADLAGFSFASTSGTTSGITVTLSASASSGVFNRTGSGSTSNFGINAAPSNDDTDAFDDGSGLTESMTFSFTTSAPATIEFLAIDFDRLDGDGTAGEDAASLAFTGGSSFTITGVNTTGLGLFTFAAPETITSGQAITLAFVDGNGFGLEQLTLNVTPIAVPEPSSVAMLMLCTLVGAGRRRKR